MIKTWSVEHFKSIYEKTELKIAPLTIFTGANSSGKSTILQSILLTTQTMQNTIYSKSVILNGHIIKLGNFDDILSYKQDSNNISIGFNLDLRGTQNRSSRLFYNANVFRKIFNYAQISCNFSFSKEVDSEITKLHPVLQSSEIEMNIIENENSYTNKINIYKSNKSIMERKEFYEIKDIDIDDTSLMYEVDTNFEKEFIRRRSLAKGKAVGAKLFHFLPERLGTVYDETLEKAKTIVGLFLNSDAELKYRIIDFENIESGFNDDFIEIIMNEIKEFNLELINKKTIHYIRSEFLKKYNILEQKFTYENYLNYIEELTEDDIKKFESKIKQKENALLDSLIRDKKSNFQLDLTFLPEPIESGIMYIKQFFLRNVKYLGPLRDEPKPVYPHSGTTDSKDVGFKGEHTAAVLEIHKNTPIRYLSPNDLEEGDESASRKATLIEAVLDWLRYMGVVEGVQTVDRGKLGHELKVLIDEESSFNDLTNVGVGVSQVLPILVLSLLAEKGSTLIFEQPELHLHPRVQTRLADFFVSMIKLNKQCIVESHSEYLINRLRYRAVVSPDESISDNIMMYFVEKEKGKSKYKPVTINNYGVIEEWPKGFFDENEENSAAILRAAMEKRKRERERTND